MNFNTDRAYGGSSGFQTGSAYKIFTLINWLQTGHKLYDVVDGTQRPFPMSSFTPSCGRTVGEPYNPANDAAWERGRMTVLDATRNSVNVAFMAMAQKLDLCDIRAVANSMGVHSASGQPLNVYPSSVLGTNEIAPLSMAAAIATIGADGVYCAPRIIDKVVGPDGKELPGQAKKCKRAISSDISRTVAYALGGGHGPRHRRRREPPRRRPARREDRHGGRVAPELARRYDDEGGAQPLGRQHRRRAEPSEDRRRRHQRVQHQVQHLPRHDGLSRQGLPRRAVRRPGPDDDVPAAPTHTEGHTAAGQEEPVARPVDTAITAYASVAAEATETAKVPVAQASSCPLRPPMSSSCPLRPLFFEE